MRTTAMIVLFFVTTLGACVDGGEPTATGTSSAASTIPPPPAPDLCDPTSQEPVPRPGGICTFEISLDQIINLAGQGVTEGAMEVNVVASADGAGKSWPGPMPATHDGFVVGSSTPVGKGYVLGTYAVPAGTNRKVKLCSTFKEVDSGGINGSTDTGTGCTWVTLTATSAPSNHVICTAAPTTPSVTADLCGPNQCNGRFKATYEVMVADADMDLIPNDDDFTPDVCDEEEKGQKGRASLVWFHMGDGPITTFFQAFGTDLSKALTGYDYKVVVVDPTYAGPFLINAAAINSADLVLSPYEANLYLAMQEITRRGYDMDIWVFSHGSQWTGSGGVEHTYFMSEDTGECTTAPAGELCGNGHDDDGDGTVDEAACTVAPAGELCWNGIDDGGDGIVDNDDGVYDSEITQNLAPDRIGTDLVPIRMVYSIACFNEGMNWAWSQVGAVVTSGTEAINFFPVFYGGFADAWNTASTYTSSVIQSDKPGDRALVEAYVLAQGGTFDCDDINLPNHDEELLSVLGLNPCAQDFFVDSDGTGADTATYDMGTSYDPALSGLGNMNAQSQRITDGDGTIKKFVPAHLSW